MDPIQREREVLSADISFEYFEKRTAEGWRVHAIEWERPSSDPGRPQIPARVQIPYGLRIAQDCRSLEEDRIEVETMMAMMEGIVLDRPLSQIADDLNRRGMRNREGRQWTQVAIFELLPRLVEFSPRFLNRPEWIERRRSLRPAAVSG